MTPRAPRRAARLWTTTATALVPLLVVTGLPACATLAYRPSVQTVSAESQLETQALSAWSRVAAVSVGTPMRVQLHEVEAPPDSRLVTGRFHAATADTLTLTLDDGQTRTLAKSTVHTVHIRRPIQERHLGWIPFVATLLTTMAMAGSADLTAKGWAVIVTSSTVPALLPGLLLQRTKRIYEARPAPPARLIPQVDVSFTDGDVVPRNEPVAVSVAHASRLGRPPDETIGLTVCLSSQPDRCTGGWAVFEGPAGRLSSPVTATLRFENETIPIDTPVPIYVHVVLTSGPSWRPSPDQAVPQLGDPGVLDVETVTRRITVVLSKN